MPRSSRRHVLAIALALAVLTLAGYAVAQVITPGPPPTTTTFQRGDRLAITASCLTEAHRAYVNDAFRRHDAMAVLEIGDVQGCAKADNSPKGAGVSPFSPRGAGVSPFNRPCGAGVSPYKPGCRLIGFVGSALNNRQLQVAIINPDSMKPACLVSANPTPHP